MRYSRSKPVDRADRSGRVWTDEVSDQSVGVHFNSSIHLFRLYLVLIKAKQDELKTLQPLRLFAPLKEAFGFSTTSPAENWQPLTPKQLIQEYELEKSQLAFTFCSPSHDGQSWVYEWDTTVLSSVMTGNSLVDFLSSVSIKVSPFQNILPTPVDRRRSPVPSAAIHSRFPSLQMTKKRFPKLRQSSGRNHKRRRPKYADITRAKEQFLHQFLLFI